MVCILCEIVTNVLQLGHSVTASISIILSLLSSLALVVFENKTVALHFGHFISSIMILLFGEKKESAMFFHNTLPH
jgi:hypothetical protein